MMLPHPIVIGPLASPGHGLTVGTAARLGNRLLNGRFSVEHLDTSDHRTGVNIGRWDWKNVTLGTSAVARLHRRLAKPRGLVYLPLSLSSGGFLRDSLFIHLAVSRGWRV